MLYLDKDRQKHINITEGVMTDLRCILPFDLYVKTFTNKKIGKMRVAVAYQIMQNKSIRSVLAVFQVFPTFVRSLTPKQELSSK